MPSPRVVVAGTSFSAVRQYLLEAMPEASLEMVEVPVLLERGHAADVLIPAMSRIDARLMDRIQGVRLIQQWGAGLEGVDVAAATARGIYVANVPTAGTGNAESVAEWCVMSAIAVSRRLPLSHDSIRAGGCWGTPIGRALLGRTAGIIGVGGIGRALALRLKPFGMRLLGLKRSPDPEMARHLGMEWIGGPERLEELLRQSDYLFLCVPLSDHTRTLIDDHALTLLPKNACIINAARGGLIDQGALMDALSGGRLAGAGLDVFEKEPLDPASPLLARSDVIATAHIAGVTDVSYHGIAQGVVENIRRVMERQAPRNCVNRDDVS